MDITFHFVTQLELPNMLWILTTIPFQFCEYKALRRILLKDYPKEIVREHQLRIKSASILI